MSIADSITAVRDQVWPWSTFERLEAEATELHRVGRATQWELKNFKDEVERLQSAYFDQAERAEAAEAKLAEAEADRDAALKLAEEAEAKCNGMERYQKSCKGAAEEYERLHKSVRNIVVLVDRIADAKREAKNALVKTDSALNELRRAFEHEP